MVLDITLGAWAVHDRTWMFNFITVQCHDARTCPLNFCFITEKKRSSSQTYHAIMDRWDINRPYLRQSPDSYKPECRAHRLRYLSDLLLISLSIVAIGNNSKIRNVSIFITKRWTIQKRKVKWATKETNSRKIKIYQ